MTKVSNPDTLAEMALESPEMVGTHVERLLRGDPPFGEMAAFAMFNIDLTASHHPNGDLLFPELAATSNGPVWLWEIRSNGGNAVDHERDDSQDAAVAHQVRVKEYTERVARGESLFEGDDNDTEVAVLEPEHTPPDEWERFWGGESPTQKQAHYRGG